MANLRMRKKTSKWRSLIQSKRKLPLAFVLIFAVIGTAFVLKSFAAMMTDDILLADQPAKGLVYSGEKIKKSGPCKGEFDLSSLDDKKKGKAHCGHIDPGPKGVDIQERAKTVDTMVSKISKYDTEHPALQTSDPLPTEDTPGPTAAAAIGSTTGLSANVTGRNWPCTNLGVTGYRVRVIYAYQAGAPNHSSTYKTFFNNTMKRVNAVIYNSSQGHRQLRLSTNSDCTLDIDDVAITGNMSSLRNVESVLASKGYDNNNKKYMVFADGGTNTPCGLGDVYSDSTANLEYNDNNGLHPQYAVVWKGCWDGPEVHELMHTLGAVVPGAPHRTAGGHCYDDNDVMCYQDADNVTIWLRCKSEFYTWIYDCGKDDYFNAVNPSGWLSTHWNTANSSFLLHM